jgi:hypothetical protein
MKEIKDILNMFAILSMMNRALFFYRVTHNAGRRSGF